MRAAVLVLQVSFSAVLVMLALAAPQTVDTGCTVHGGLCCEVELVVTTFGQLVNASHVNGNQQQVHSQEHDIYT